MSNADKSIALPKDTSLWSWLKNEKVLIIVLGVLIADAVSRVVVRFIEQVATPLFQSAVGLDPNNVPYVLIGKAKIPMRSFLVSLFEFALVILIAYLISKSA